jgi:hypothetical protein
MSTPEELGQIPDLNDTNIVIEEDWHMESITPEEPQPDVTLTPPEDDLNDPMADLENHHQHHPAPVRHRRSRLDFLVVSVLLYFF